MINLTKCPICKYDDVNLKANKSGKDGYDIKCKICGDFEISRIAKIMLDNKTELYNSYILSAIIRENNYLKQPPIVITTYYLEEDYLERHKLTIDEKLNKILLYIYNNTEITGKYISLIPKYDYPIAYAFDKNEFDFFLKHLQKSDFINLSKSSNVIKSDDGRTSINMNEIYNILLTIEGLKKIDKIKTEKKISGNQCFVAMWFDEKMNDVYSHGFEVAISEAGYKPIRIDKVDHNGKICDRIIAEIRQSKLVVADFTGHRGGVYFEAGFAMGLGIPVIWTCKEDHIEQCHFDTRQYNHICWENTEDLKKQLIDRITALFPIIK